MDTISGLRKADVEGLIEPPGTHDGRIDHIVAIGGRHEEDAATGQFHAVHLRQELIDDAIGGTGVAVTRAARTQGVEFVEEDDARHRVPGPLEHLTHAALRFAEILHIFNRITNIFTFFFTLILFFLLFSTLKKNLLFFLLLYFFHFFLLKKKLRIYFFSLFFPFFHFFKNYLLFFTFILFFFTFST